MHAIPNFKKVVTKLADGLQIDLSRPGTYFRLVQGNCGYLIIENLGNSRISLTNYVQVGNDWAADPRVITYVSNQDEDDDFGENDWYPMEISEFFGGWQLCAEVSQEGDLLVRDDDLMREMANVIDDLIVASLLMQDWQRLGTLAQDAVITPTREYAEPHDFFVEQPDDVPF